MHCLLISLVLNKLVSSCRIVRSSLSDIYSAENNMAEETSNQPIVCNTENNTENHPNVSLLVIICIPALIGALTDLDIISAGRNATQGFSF